MVKGLKSLNDIIHILKLFVELYETNIEIPDIEEYDIAHIYKTKKSKWDDETNLFLDNNLLLKYDFHYSNFEKIEDENQLIVNQASSDIAQQIEQILKKEDNILFAFLKEHLSTLYIFIYNKGGSISLYSIKDKLPSDINSFNKLKNFLVEKTIEDISKSEDIVKQTKNFINNNPITEIEISTSQDYKNYYNMLCWVSIEFPNSDNIVGLYVILKSQWNSEYFFINSDDFNLRRYIEDEEEKTINTIYKIDSISLLFKTKDWMFDEVPIKWIKDKITEEEEEYGNNDEYEYY